MAANRKYEYQPEVIFDDVIGKPDPNLLKNMFESSL